MGHCDSAQQNSLDLPGPTGPSRTLTAAEIDYAPVGPVHYSSNISSPCADGGRVMWGHGIDRIVKLDHDSFNLVATYEFPDVEAYSIEDERQSVERLNTNNSGLLGVINAVKDAVKLPELPGVYTLLDKDNRYFIGKNNGTISVFGDAQPDLCHSGIKPLHEFQLPKHITGNLIGMNMTFDGWVVLATEHGYVVAINRGPDEMHEIRVPHSELAEEQSFGPGKGWIRNGFPIDREGGIYLVSQDYLHKVVWTGEKLSVEKQDGAWSEAYINEEMIGSGSTPSLMGFDDEDQLVVITDGQKKMHLTAFWRNDIPEDWEALPEAPNRRITGLAPVTMERPELKKIQSEQTTIVSGYGAFVVNNMPRNFPWYLPEQPRLTDRLRLSWQSSGSSTLWCRED